jgi:protein O-mannosyl-transferase
MKQIFSWNNVARVFIALLTFRVCYLFTAYVFSKAGVQRFHLESAAFIFVILGFLYRLRRHRSDSDARDRGGVNVLQPAWSGSVLLWLAFCVAAFALYRSTLSIGFLSDDFTLTSHVLAWDIGPITSELFRPLPLLMWAVLLNAGAGAMALHAVNILLHGTNAYLTARFVSGWTVERDWGVLAGLVMLTMPLGPEAVAWCSGVFDVMATTFIMTAVLLARRYEQSPSVATRFSLVAMGILALLCKETAAVLPVLLLLDAWIRKKFSRTLLVDVGVLLAVMGTVGAVRLALRFGVTSPPINVRSIRRALFRSFGGLAFPWHTDALEASRFLPLIAGLAIIGLVAAFLMRAGRISATRAAAGCAGWIVVAILPVFNVFYIAPDLQSSRYLYLSSVGWAGLVATLGSDIARRHVWSRVIPRAAILVTAALAIWGVRIHLQPWVEAARLRDVVDRAAAQDERLRSCDPVFIRDLPDSVRGAYVFRVGASEELQRTAGLHTLPAAEPGPCSFRWDPGSSAFLVSDN